MTRLELAAKRKRIQVEVARRELVEAQLVQDEEKEQVTKAAVKRPTARHPSPNFKKSL